MEVDTSFAGLRVTRVLDGIIAERGLPQAIRCDNGPELTSRHFLAWALDRRIELVHIHPGKPTQNGIVESFNGKLREECLRIHWFQNLFEARRIITNWRRDYNERRPHSSLSYLTSAEFAAKNSGWLIELRRVRKLGAGYRDERARRTRNRTRQRCVRGRYYQPKVLYNACSRGCPNLADRWHMARLRFT